MGNPEFEKFDAVVRKVFSVSHDEIVKREKQYQRKRKQAKKKGKTGGNGAHKDDAK